MKTLVLSERKRKYQRSKLINLIDTDQARWIPGFENLYAATRDGQIIAMPSMKKGKRPMSLQTLNTGYLIVSLRDKEGKRKTYLASRLILSTYEECPFSKACVSYKDSNKKNVNLENLFWSKRSDLKPGAAPQPIDLVKDGGVIHFKGINKARLFLKQGWTYKLREAAEQNELIKGYKIIKL